MIKTNVGTMPNRIATIKEIASIAVSKLNLNMSANHTINIIWLV